MLFLFIVGLSFYELVTLNLQSFSLRTFGHHLSANTQEIQEVHILSHQISETSRVFQDSKDLWKKHIQRRSDPFSIHPHSIFCYSSNPTMQGN